MFFTTRNTASQLYLCCKGEISAIDYFKLADLLCEAPDGGGAALCLIIYVTGGENSTSSLNYCMTQQ